MKCFLPFVLYCLSAIFFTQSIWSQDYNSILNKNREEWHDYIHKKFYTNWELRNDSVAFFKEVSKLRKAAQKANDIQLILETDFLRLNYLSSKDYPNYLKEVDLLKQKVDQEGIEQLQARVRQAIALHHFYETRNYVKALENISDSYQYIKNLPPADSPDKQELLFNIGFIYYMIGYEYTALEYLDQAQKVPVGEYYPQLPLNIMNTKGMIYLAKDRVKEALEMFNQVHLIAERDKREIWIRVSMNNLAKTYYQQYQFNKALQYLRWEDFQDTSDLERLNIQLKKQILLSFIYIATNKEERALIEIQKLEKILSNHKTTKGIDDLEHIYYLRAYAENQKGAYKRAYELLDSALVLTNEAHQIKNAELIKKHEDKENIEKYFRHKTEIENQKKINTIIWVGAICVVVLLFIIFMISTQKQKILHRQKQIQLELEKKQIEQELDQATQKLNRLTASFLEKNKEIQQYQEELRLMEQQPEKNEQIMERINHLNTLLSEAIITDEKWIQFKRAFEKVHVNFIARLKTKLPLLSEAEIRYVVLRKLNLSPKEIAALLGIQPDSIRLYRYRIRKKHHIENDATLEKIIFNL